MSVLWTNYGAKAVLSKCFETPPINAMGSIFGVVLEGPPIMDRERTSFLQYPYTFTKLEFFAFVVGAGTPHALTIAGGRAVLQWGPPALSLNVVSGFTCYGMIWCTDTFDVLWVDKWAEAKSYTAGDSVRILPWVTMTSECPPLGGCP